VTFPTAEVSQAVGAQPVRWEPASGSGYGINTSRSRVELADGRTVFVKVALDELAAGWLRKEHNVYASVTAPFIPELQGWHDEGETLLAIEDLSDAHWPPPWPSQGVDAVLSALNEIHATPPPPGLGWLEELLEGLDGWPRIAAAPGAVPVARSVLLRVARCRPARARRGFGCVRAGRRRVPASGRAQ